VHVHVSRGGVIASFIWEQTGRFQMNDAFCPISPQGSAQRGGAAASNSLAAQTQFHLKRMGIVSKILETFNIFNHTNFRVIDAGLTLSLDTTTRVVTQTSRRFG
jgi:hypothetical protein